MAERKQNGQDWGKGFMELPAGFKDAHQEHLSERLPKGFKDAAREHSNEGRRKRPVPGHSNRGRSIGPTRGNY